MVQYFTSIQRDGLRARGMSDLRFGALHGISVYKYVCFTSLNVATILLGKLMPTVTEEIPSSSGDNKIFKIKC